MEFWLSQKWDAGINKKSLNIVSSIIRLFFISSGETWVRVYHNDAEILPTKTIEAIQKSVTIVDKEILKSSRIIDVIKPD